MEQVPDKKEAIWTDQVNNEDSITGRLEQVMKHGFDLNCQEVEQKVFQEKETN